MKDGTGNCNECGAENMPYIEFGLPWASLSTPIDICFDCILKATKLLQARIDKENTVTRIVRHQVLGVCSITEECEKLQLEHPDKTSVFVEHTGKIIEVSKKLISQGIGKYFLFQI
jgi:hypothetical protein